MNQRVKAVIAGEPEASIWFAKRCLIAMVLLSPFAALSDAGAAVDQRAYGQKQVAPTRSLRITIKGASYAQGSRRISLTFSEPIRWLYGGQRVVVIWSKDMGRSVSFVSAEVRYPTVSRSTISLEGNSDGIARLFSDISSATKIKPLRVLVRDSIGPLAVLVAG